MTTSRCLKLSAPLLLMLTAATNDTAGPRYTAAGALIPPMEYREWVFLSSGQTHGAVDTTFTQFYPTAKPIAVKSGTYQGDE